MWCCASHVAEFSRFIFSSGGSGWAWGVRTVVAKFHRVPVRLGEGHFIGAPRILACQHLTSWSSVTSSCVSWLAWFGLLPDYSNVSTSSISWSCMSWLAWLDLLDYSNMSTSSVSWSSVTSFCMSWLPWVDDLLDLTCVTRFTWLDLLDLTYLICFAWQN